MSPVDSAGGRVVLTDSGPLLMQILMASDPLWATLISGLPFFASGEQDLGPGGWVGGACIVAGAILAGSGGPAAPEQAPHDEDD